MSRREASLLALLVAVPGWAAILTLALLDQVAAGVAALAGLGALALAAGVAKILARRLAQLRAWLKPGGEKPRPPAGAMGEIAGDVARLERNWQQREAAQAGRLADRLAILDGLPDPVLTLDGQAHVMFANKAARALLAVDDRGKDPAGRPLSSMLRQPGLLSAIGQAGAGEPGQRIDVTLAGKVERFVEAWVEPLSAPDGGQPQVLVVVRDMTAVRRSEGVRADFVANVSHELRTPLASLLGFIETLQGPAADDAGAQARFLALMDAQAARMARLVDDLLSLSRIEMNEHQPAAESVALSPLLQSVADSLAPQAMEKNMAVAITVAADLPAVAGDRDDLARLFQNLIENAIKYGRAGSIVKVSAAGAGEAVSVTVSDQGEGIAREHLPRLTERFYRVDAARSRALGGTGLGLAIVKHIVNRHHGRLRIDSEPGVGSRFAVTLPVFGDDAAVTELQ